MLLTLKASMSFAKPKKIQQNLGNVAVVGSGPAGLSVAGDMAKLGYNVTVFEGQSEPGGVLLFGIPEFRLSKSVVRREIARLEGLGVKFVCNIFIGQDKTLDDLFAEALIPSLSVLVLIFLKKCAWKTMKYTAYSKRCTC